MTWTTCRSVTGMLAEHHYLGPIDRGVAWRDEFGAIVVAPPTARRLPLHWLELVRWCLVRGVKNDGAMTSPAPATLEREKDKRLPYPPPWQDIATLCAHICVSPNTVDAWVKAGWLPAPKMVGGKRLWKWSEVDRLLGSGDDDAPTPENLAERIRHATKAAAQGRQN
jgi:hypothetical protein